MCVPHIRAPCHTVARDALLTDAAAHDCEYDDQTLRAAAPCGASRFPVLSTLALILSFAWWNGLYRAACLCASIVAQYEDVEQTGEAELLSPTDAKHRVLVKGKVKLPKRAKSVLKKSKTKLMLSEGRKLLRGGTRKTCLMANSMYKSFHRSSEDERESTAPDEEELVMSRGRRTDAANDAFNAVDHVVSLHRIWCSCIYAGPLSLSHSLSSALHLCRPRIIPG